MSNINTLNIIVTQNGIIETLLSYHADQAGISAAKKCFEKLVTNRINEDAKYDPDMDIELEVKKALEDWYYSPNHVGELEFTMRWSELESDIVDTN
jgi:hypothetical protein